MKCEGCLLDISSEVLGRTIAEHEHYPEVWHVKCYYNQYGGRVAKKNTSLDGTKLGHWEEVVTEWLRNKKSFNLLIESDYDGNEEALLRDLPHLYRRSSTWRVKSSLRARLYAFVKGKNKSSSFQYVGCSVDELKKHLASQFKEGMTWQNYGEWHIDHIRPCASFDLSLEEERHACFNYENLQPLWAEENLRKGAGEMKQ